MDCNRDTSASTGQLSTASSGGGGLGGGGGMHHSHSTPAGVDGGGTAARTPPATPKKGGKMLAIRVQMLDDSITIFQVQAKAVGKVLFEQVCKQLHLLEADYFGLEYQDLAGTKYWLDLQKPVSRQLGLSLVDPLLHFCVKFYTPDPSQLEEEYTRYLFCLQVKRDLSHGYLQCNDNTAALMASYIVQAECGDYVSEDYPDHTYLSSYKFVPHQDHEMERRIMENHKKHAGQSPAEADLNLLETARRCELYGIKMYPAKDHENVSLNLAVAHMGILVFQNYTKINTFSWAKIRKISFKRKRFLIKLHPEGYGYYKDIVEFFFEGRNECKNFWKKCVENHGFFRCAAVKTVSRHKTRVLSRGSSFRYSGKTQKQIVEFVRDNYIKRQAFQRSASFRHSSAHSSATNMHTSAVGNSISAHPLLPLGDSTLSVEAAKLSASLGSMGESGPAEILPASQTMRSVSRPPDTATSWSSTIGTTPPPQQARSTTQFAQTMTLPSPPLTTQSDSPVTSATTSPQHRTRVYHLSNSTSSPVAVRAAIHKAAVAADTGIITHITTSRTPSSQTAAAPPSLLTNSMPSQTQSQNDLEVGDDDSAPYSNYSKRKIWQRSASCRELNDYSFEESGQAKRRAKPKRTAEKTYINLEERTLDSPVTRYDNRSVYATSRDNSLEIAQDIMISDHKVYSSSYPGTVSYSQESVEDPGNYDLRDSQDDLSHDSYELLERSDDDFSFQKLPKILNARSCSLDSGNYLPSDLDSEPEFKCKSSFDIFMADDPRDYPRETVPRKSDGSFYRSMKFGSRTSSLESEGRSRKSSREQSFGSRTWSQESRSEYDGDVLKNKSSESVGEGQIESRNSSLDYYDANNHNFIKYTHDYDRRIPFERNYFTHKSKVDEEVNHNVSEISHVHSVSLQNVETSEMFRSNGYPDQNTIPRAQKPIPPMSKKAVVESRRSTESESNIFSFDDDHIQSLQEAECKESKRKDIFREVFVEIEPKRGRDGVNLHQPIERTKSDPNSLAMQRVSMHHRRHLLMHQKSIDLTPAESSDDDYLYRQIPSAPPIMKYRGSHFEMPTAEFGHFDVLKQREIEGQKTKFQVPKSQFEILGAKTQSDLVNLPPKNDIPYTLHKRHVMNGTALKEDQQPKSETKSPVKEPSSFLFTQNIDLSKVDPVTLEVDKSKIPVHHMSSPKRDITHIDPALLETLNSKLSQIESDSPTSSKTESLKPKEIKPDLLKFKVNHLNQKVEKQPEPVKLHHVLPPKENRIKTETKPKRVIKPRSQGNKKIVNKSKVRITSFSSDDESLDSDDVFGSAEATPTKLEFSPPQTRKEMESILKHEAERKYLQYTMSSTEVEGSPPQTRKSEIQFDRSLDSAYQTELRRISERSISIPSSEEEFNVNTADMQPVFADSFPDLLPSVPEDEKDKSGDSTLCEQLEEEEDDEEERVNEKEEGSLLQELPIGEDKETKEKEKAKLRFDIEQDIRELRVPSKTRITEICSPSVRKKGHSPLLFAHARLNLSEGSAFTMLQKQQATESPLPGRRAKSLDTPIVAVNRLPPLNALSSKDDTVEEYESLPPPLPEKPKPSPPSSKTDDSVQMQKPPERPPKKPKVKPETDQIVPDVTAKPKKPGKSQKPPSERVLPNQLSLALPSQPKEIKRARSQETETSKRPPPQTEKARSLDKYDSKRTSSRERSKSQEDSDTDIAKRQEKQQMLYETAIKQTKTIKSPVKDVLPVFPQVEEAVWERHGKLEISINTIENPAISLEEAIIITKSPKRLDKKMDKKLTKSLELNLSGDEGRSVRRLGKSLDLDATNKSDLEFDFRTETIAQLEKEASPPDSNKVVHVQAEVHKEPHEEGDVNVTLEGTSLDVWLSMETTPKENKLPSSITVIQGSNDFFEERSKPPDLGKIDPKSSSDSQSLERTSLGNSLDIKYIDDSSASSHKSEQDAKLAAELKKASETVGRLLAKKLAKRKETENVIRITSEDESLTEVSDLRCEADSHLLGVTDAHKDSLLKLSIERSRSEDTGSWVTVECDEFVGTEDSFDFDGGDPKTITEDSVDMKTMTESPIIVESHDGDLKDSLIPPQNDKLLSGKMDLLKRCSDHSRSSDTTGSWTSGEKDLSPSNLKETGDESSVSCTMGQAIGIGVSQLVDKSSPELEPPRSPRSPRICVLGRAFTIDEDRGPPPKSDESSSEEAIEIPKDSAAEKKRYPFEEKWSGESELGQRVHQKIVKKLSSATEDKLLEKRALLGVEKLSAESRSSLDTESSSGSFGLAVRLQKSGEGPGLELSSTWKSFPLESSGSSSLEEGIVSIDQDREYFISAQKVDADVTPTGADVQDDLADFPTNFGYPCLTSAVGGIGIGTTEVLGGYGASFLTRTLSRISERSTNSDKSSIDEDSTKASTQDSLNDESIGSTDRQASLSSDTPSHAHVSDSDKKTGSANYKPSKISSADHISNINNLLLQRQISDDRRTSAEMAELSIDDIEIITSESGLRLKRQGSDDTVIDEEENEFDRGGKKSSSSQESDEWPLPEIPNRGDSKTLPLLALHEAGSSDASQLTTQVFKPPQMEIPRIFGLRGSLKSQDSEPWPSPPSSIQEPAVVGNVETHYITPPEEACKVTVDSNTVSSTYDNYSNSDNDDDNRTLESAASEPTYENVAPDQISEAISETYSGVRIIVENKSGNSSSSNSAEELNVSNLNDDVFVDGVEAISSKSNELRPPTVLRRSTTSDDSSHSGRNKKKDGSQHSSYSDEDCTSSFGTNLEDGTVRFALKPTKCTHSSHSEDTSVALSLSEWSNSTNTVKFQNLSTSNSGATKSSGGLKSDDNSLADIAQSISEWSSSNSNTLKAQSTSLQFQKLSSSASTGDSSTLTEFIPTLSERSSSDASKTLVPQTFYTPAIRQSSVSRLGSSIDEMHEQKSPQNIPSEDQAIATIKNDAKFFSKSTERPIVIPPQFLSDTETSSLELKTTVCKEKMRSFKVPLSKCSPYYSSSLSSESTPVAASSVSKTATVPLMRGHRKQPISKAIFQSKSPPSENDSTSSMESPKNTPQERRGYRRRRQAPQKKKERHHATSLGEYLNTLAADKGNAMFQYAETLEEGYFPDGDSQSGSDIFRMERDEELYEIGRDAIVEGFDVTSIPPPLLEDGRPREI